MGFDPIQHAMCEDTAKQAAKSQRVGGVDKHTISARMGDINNTDFVVMGGVGFSHISSLTPTKEEINAGKMRIGAGELSEVSIASVMFDDSMVYGFTFRHESGNENYVIAVAYQTGAWNGHEIPKTGVYFHKVLNASDDVKFFMEYETIHPIDPKFIPGDYIVDLDALGFTSDAVREGVELPAEVANALKKTASSCGGIVVKLGRSVCRLPNFFSAEGLEEYSWGGCCFTGEIIWITAYFEPADNYFVLVDTPLMSAASEEKLDV